MVPPDVTVTGAGDDRERPSDGVVASDQVRGPTFGVSAPAVLNDWYRADSPSLKGPTAAGLVPLRGVVGIALADVSQSAIRCDGE